MFIVSVVFRVVSSSGVIVFVVVVCLIRVLQMVDYAIARSAAAAKSQSVSPSTSTSTAQTSTPQSASGAPAVSVSASVSASSPPQSPAAAVTASSSAIAGQCMPVLRICRNNRCAESLLQKRSPRCCLASRSMTSSRSSPPTPNCRTKFALCLSHSPANTHARTRTHFLAVCCFCPCFVHAGPDIHVLFGQNAGRTKDLRERNGVS